MTDTSLLRKGTERLILRSRAYANEFFEAASRGARAEDVRTFILEWYPVTEAFCLALPRYTAVFADAIRAASGERRSRLEEAVRIPVEICAQELGLEGEDASGIHYRMFARLGEPLGLDLEFLRGRGDGTLPETRSLVSAIRECFEDLYEGAGCIRVVEATAYNIVEAMDRIFGRLRTDYGNPLYDERQLEYISLHLVIEKEHDSMTEDFLTFADNEEEQRRVHKGAERISTRFGDYWDTLAGVVFGQEVA